MLLARPERRPRPASPRPPELVRPPWERDEATWETLEPTGAYARRWRTPFLWSVSLGLALGGLVFAFPIALVNACLYGPTGIFFVQPRVGYRGRLFRLLKFRTMSGRPGDGPDRLRVTRFGRFLRNTHLDELPQLVNVLCGEMSLIGPRPEMLDIEAWAGGFLPRFSERLVLRPGLTGWAQVTQGYAGDGDEIAYARKLAINDRYREALSFGADLHILYRTVLWVLRARGWRPRGVRQRKAA